MTSTTPSELQPVLDAAVEAGVLPAGTTPPDAAPDRPWPLVLLTTLGAWLSAIPLCGVLVLIFGNLLSSGAGAYFLGPILLVCAVMMLRQDQATLFVEQLAVPLLLLGGGTLAYGLYRDLAATSASLVMAGLALGVAVGVRHRWIQALLGGTCCVLVAMFILFMSTTSERFGITASWIWLGLWLRASVLIWIGMLLWKRQLGGQDGGLRRAVESVAIGWVLATLANLSMSTGPSFLIGASLDHSGSTPAGSDGGLALSTVAGTGLLSGLSMLMALAGGTWLWREWPALRRPWWAGCGALALGLTWLMPALGPVWLVMAVAVTGHRWRVASAAGLAAVWTLGSFYYSLALPLATKAGLLGAAGVVLGALVVWARRDRGRDQGRDRLADPAVPPAANTAPQHHARLGIALTALATLVAVNVAIWQKEDLIRHGRAIYVELAPVDPRSLMQGDYMALSYQMSPQLREQLEHHDSLESPLALARVDARGVARLDRLAGPTDQPASGEMPVRLMSKNGRWSVVSDAWYFKEGTGAHWQVARYGEFRVMPDGRALLVGMADGALRPIKPVDSLPAPVEEAASAGQ